MKNDTGWNPLLSVCVVVPLGLWCGELVYEMAPTNQSVWLVIGTLFSILLLHGIAESVFALDFRAMFKKQGQLAVSMTLAIVFLGIMYGNTNRYNSYVASEEAKKGISGKEIRPILSFTGNPVKQQDFNINTEHVNNTNKIGNTTIEYTLKNGRHIARYYEFDLQNETNIAMLDMIIGTESFKDDFYVFYSLNSDEITTMYLTNGFETKALEMSDPEQRAFMEAYLHDFSKLTYSEMLNQQRVGKIYFSTSELWNLELCIYSSFSSTLDFLDKREVGELFDCDVQLQQLEVCEPDHSKIEFVVTNELCLEELEKGIIFDEFYYADEYICGSENTRMAYVKIRINGNIESKTVWITEEMAVELKNN